MLYLYRCKVTRRQLNVFFAELVDTTVFQTGHRHDTIHTKIMNKKMNYD